MITVVERFAVGWPSSTAISPVWRLSPYIEGESFWRFPLALFEAKETKSDGWIFILYPGMRDRGMGDKGMKKELCGST